MKFRLTRTFIKGLCKASTKTNIMKSYYNEFCLSKK